MIIISNSTGNFSLGPPVLLCSEYMKMKISDLVMFAEVDLVSIPTQHQHMIKRSEIIQLHGSARTQERHLFWCWKQIGASKFTGPAWITHEDFRFSDGLQHDKKQWNNSVVALKCSKTSATIYSASTLPLPNSALPIVFTNGQINANALFLFAENEVNGFCSRWTCFTKSRLWQSLFCVKQIKGTPLHWQLDWKPEA